MILLWLVGVTAIVLSAMAVLLFVLGLVVADATASVVEKVRHLTRFD